jgi:hypothetical protein
MSDSFTEVTTRGWGSRILDSIKGLAFGLILIIASGIGLFWNEGRAVQTERSLTEGAGAVVDIDPARVDPANDGNLVHVSGGMKPGGAVVDREFGVSANGLRLVRTVEMYQWKEEQKSETRKNFGGSEETVTTYSYVHTWSDRRFNSRDFSQPDGHGNPEMRYAGVSVIAPDVTLGAYKPSARVVEMLPASAQVNVDPALAEQARAHISGPLSVANGMFYIGASPDEPHVGDLRVGYKQAPAGPVSVIGQAAGTDFTGYQTKAGDRLLLVQPGALSAAAMFDAAQHDNEVLTWVIRLIGVVAMFIGFALVLGPLVVVADVVPLIGDILGAGTALVSLVATLVVAPVVIAIAWFFYRPIVAIAVLVVGFALAYGVRKLAPGRKTPASPAQSAAAG